MPCVACLPLQRQYVRVIYLDHNATTPIASEVLEVMMPYLTADWGNPSSTYKFGAKLNGDKTQRLANTTNITFHGIESEALLILLDQENVCASFGSACLADSDEPSHVVVKAMKPESVASRQIIRFSLGPENTAAEVNAAWNAVESAVRMLRS
jgi:cysteine sulfinate desulfinase/cysteine desulfurase-like protein